MHGIMGFDGETIHTHFFLLMQPLTCIQLRIWA